MSFKTAKYFLIILAFFEHSVKFISIASTCLHDFSREAKRAVFQIFSCFRSFSQNVAAFKTLFSPPPRRSAGCLASPPRFFISVFLSTYRPCRETRERRGPQAAPTSPSRQKSRRPFGLRLFISVLLSTCRPCRERERRERGARAYRPPGTRWSGPWRRRKRHSPERSGSPWRDR